MKHNAVTALLLTSLLAFVSAGCGATVDDSTASCSFPAELPVTADMPDGGELRLYQTVTSEIAGTERDTFTISAHCRPGVGYKILVNVPEGSAMDVSYSILARGQYFETNLWGPGIGEGSTLVLTYSSPTYPFGMTIEVWSVNGETGPYTISVNPDPMP